MKRNKNGKMKKNLNFSCDYDLFKLVLPPTLTL